MPVPHAEKAVGRGPTGAAGRPGKNLPTNRERVQNLYSDATVLHEEMSSSQKGLKPEKVKNPLQTVKDLTKDLVLLPLNDWQHELRELRQELSQGIQAVKAALTEPPARQSIRSFAESAARAPAPAHQLSRTGSASSSPARPDSSRDHEVVICLNDRSQVAEYRRKTSAEIVTQANQVRAKHARSTGTPTLSSVMVQAARQLKSGDIRLTVRDAKEAELMRVHREKWVKVFGRTAFVHRPTWGVIVHGMQVKSLVDKPSVEALRNVQASKGEAIVA
ncbi:hypothetical protein N7532_002995 [Penicillium argentinense]|uniref:Uncharacterized protein n=1 Tax=Penicillium argentinense TaxID=1131581 RepID=A0A9W9KE35_9EURO|nr:uncharacterized protein N7532_002995 [Penicillium argentinense]KAJ5102466.1 hypothetical protein N7532_002995 [Penicillium argentinense]